MHQFLNVSRDVTRFIIGLSAFLTLLLAGCGGGGGGGSTPSSPYILASVISFPTGAVPAGLVPSGLNSAVSVSILDNTSGAPITSASATVNGTILYYNSAYQDYEGAITLAPGGAISLRVTVGGTTYTSSSSQFTSYPTITAPASGDTWSSLTTNLASWSGVAPNTTSLYGLGVFDSISGQLIWPSGGAIEVLPTTTTSATISPGSLTAGSRIFIVGLTTFVGIANAAPNSGIVIGGFNYVPFTVTNGTTASLVSIAVTPNNPTVTIGKTQQLTATGTYSDNSMQDLSTQVTWASSDTTKATVSSTGLVTGTGYGSATITATSGSVSGSTTVKVFQPTPSPSPPLSQSVAYQIDYAHSGSATFANPIVYPSSPAWSKTLNGAASYPLIAGGAVFVTTAGTSTGNGTQLLALNELDGSVLWGPVDIPGTYNWSGLAYDHGMVFVINYDGFLQTFDAATGVAGWSTQLPGQYAFSSPPTAVNGIVYAGGAGVGGTLYAVDESDGSLLWTSRVMNGDHSSPAVSSDGVFVSYPCQVYKFDPITGSPLWHYSGPCEGGGGKTPAYANGTLYVRDPNQGGGEVFDAAIGTKVGTFTATPIPALSTQAGFFLNAGTLQAIDLTTHNLLWSFTGDGLLVSAPIVINQTVFVGSSSGKVYAVDTSTGSPQTWIGAAGAAITGPDEQNLIQPLTGFGAGEGYLIVPAGSVLTAWKLN